jgi:hypothetical protein
MVSDINKEFLPIIKKDIDIPIIEEDLFEALDLEIYSPNAPEWFINWMQSNSEVKTSLNKEQINWILNEANQAKKDRKIQLDNQEIEDQTEYDMYIYSINRIEKFFKKLI